MELSVDIVKGLQELGNAQQIPDAAFKDITEAAFRTAMNKSNDQKLTAIKGVEPITLKQSFAALVSFLLEGAKQNYDPVQMKGVLEEQEVVEQRREYIVKLYGDTKSTIREVLSSFTGFGFPHVVDVDWRLDYFMKSNTLEKVNSPVYFISLKTKRSKNLEEKRENEDEEGEPEKDVSLGKAEFSCSLEQLQDLLTKLKDAVKQVERSGSNL